mgnify:CR=1 FL=1
MSVFERLMTLYASTRLQRPNMTWEWRISEDVAQELVDHYRPDTDPKHIATLLGWPAKVMDGATPGTIGLVRT